MYTNDVPFQYNEREGRYTEFTGNPIGIIFVAGEGDGVFLLGQRSNNLICQVIQKIVGSY